MDERDDDNNTMHVWVTRRLMGVEIIDIIRARIEDILPTHDAEQKKEEEEEEEEDEYAAEIDVEEKPEMDEESEVERNKNVTEDGAEGSTRAGESKKED